MAVVVNPPVASRPPKKARERHHPASGEPPPKKKPKKARTGQSMMKVSITSLGLGEPTLLAVPTKCLTQAGLGLRVVEREARALQLRVRVEEVVAEVLHLVVL